MSKKALKDYFAVLDLKPDASEYDIKKAFRHLAKRWHPDKNASNDAGEKMKEINAAYKYLQSKDRREILETDLRRRAKKAKSTSSRCFNGNTSDKEQRSSNWQETGCHTERDEDNIRVRCRHCGKLFKRDKIKRHKRSCGERKHKPEFSGSERGSNPGPKASHNTGARRGEGVGVFCFKSGVRGFHAYRDIWNPRIGEMLIPVCEKDNAYDKYAVALLNERSKIVGHVPREFSQISTQFIEQGGKMKCRILSDRFVRGKGLEIPCMFIYKGPNSLIKDLKASFKTQAQL